MERPKNPNEALIRELILEDMPLLKMLATNGRSKPDFSLKWNASALVSAPMPMPVSRLRVVLKSTTCSLP